MNQDVPVVQCHLLDTGYCLAWENHVIQGGTRRKIACHSLVALLRHPEHGWLLWDTGYAPRMLEETQRLPFKLYRYATPLRIKPDLAVAAHLSRWGLVPGDIRRVLISHFQWNSTTWDEFSRKWNKPVHTFLLRHVYASTLSSYRVSRFTAMFLTFLLSAAAHELVMTIVTKKIRMYLFVLQLIQIPLILVSRAPFIKRNKLMGNVVFWLGLYAGFPLLCVAYVAY